MTTQLSDNHMVTKGDLREAVKTISERQAELRADEVTNAELYRLLCTIKEEHGEELREIRQQTTETNGRVIAAETRLSGHDREIGELKKGRGVHPHQQQRVADRPDAITLNIPTTKATITVLITVAGGIIAAAFTAAAKLLGLM